MAPDSLARKAMVPGPVRGVENFRAVQLLLAACAGVFLASQCLADNVSVTWQLDNLDAIGGHVVEVAGNPKVIDTPGGRAIEFDGIDDGIFLDVNPLARMPAFTVEIVFRPYRGGAPEQRFFHMQEAGSESRVMFETRLVEHARWFLDTFIKSGEQQAVLFAQGNEHPLDRWYHAAIVMDGTSIRHYVNGRLELAHEIVYLPQGKGRTSLGVRLNRVHWFKGALRTARFTPRALSPVQFLSSED